MIEIDRYETRMEKGKPKWFAVKGKQSYPMPDAFSAMYTDDYLAIEKVSNPRSEMFDIKESEYYIPLRT